MHFITMCALAAFNVAVGSQMIQLPGVPKAKTMKACLKQEKGMRFGKPVLSKVLPSW